MMKKTALLITLTFIVSSLFAQDIIYTISGEINNEKVPLDSILIENLSNNTWISFTNLPDEEYYLINLTKSSYWGTTGINSFENNSPGFSEAINTPGQISLKYNNLLPTKARFAIFNLNGQEIYSSGMQTVFPGNSVQVKLAETGVFLVRVESELGRQAFKGIGLASTSNYGISIADNSNFDITTKSAARNFESDFNFNLGDSLRLSVYKNEYYAQPKGKKIISSEIVDFEFKYSEVNISGVSDAFVDVDNQTTNIENYNPLTGKLSLSYTGNSIELIPGNVIAVDADTTGYLRKITNVINNTDGSVTLETEQAHLNDVFVNKEINLDTELIEPNSSVKSSGSELDISKALTDENGYIHPVEIIYHYETGNKVKSALAGNSANDGVVPLFDVNDDFSNTTIFQNNNVNFYIEQGYSKLNGNATFYFFFTEGTQIDPQSKIKKGELELFSYNMKNTYDFKTHLKLEITDSYSSESSKELLAPKSVTAKFLVGAVPAWITFNLSIHGKMTVSADASVVADWGFQNKITSNTGAAFSNETGDFVQNNPTFNESLTIDPLKIEGDFNLNARLELYPRIEAMVYNFVGPFVELVPYTTGEVKGKVTSEITNNGAKEFWAWNSNVAAGFDTRVGAKLDFAGIFEDEEFGPLNFNLYNKILWEAPKTLKLVSEIPQEVKVGDVINLEFEVYDSENNSLAGCPIYVEGEGKFNQEISTTGTNGRTSVSWEISTDENGDNQANFSAKIFDADKNVINEINKSISLNNTSFFRTNNTYYNLSHGYILHEYENDQIVQSMLVLCSEDRTWDRNADEEFPGTGSFIAFDITSLATTGTFTRGNNTLDDIWFQTSPGNEKDAIGAAELEVSKDGDIYTISFSADNVTGYYKGFLNAENPLIGNWKVIEIDGDLIDSVNFRPYYDCRNITEAVTNYSKFNIQFTNNEMIWDLTYIYKEYAYTYFNRSDCSHGDLILKKVYPKESGGVSYSYQLINQNHIKIIDKDLGEEADDWYLEFNDDNSLKILPEDGDPLVLIRQ